MKRLAAVIACLLYALPVQARDVDGVTVPETLTLAGEKAALVLNGAGLRTRYLAKVYVAALYVARPASRPEAVLDSKDARAIAIHMRRDTDAEQIATAFLTSVAKNHDRAEMQALQDRLTRFKLMMPALKRDDALRLEFATSGATRVVVNDQLVGALDGADFQRALLRIWLGSRPVDTDLKRFLLGARR
jgi:hypothetical protein